MPWPLPMARLAVVSMGILEPILAGQWCLCHDSHRRFRSQARLVAVESDLKPTVPLVFSSPPCSLEFFLESRTAMGGFMDLSCCFFYVWAYNLCVLWIQTKIITRKKTQKGVTQYRGWEKSKNQTVHNLFHVLTKNPADGFSRNDDQRSRATNKFPQCSSVQDQKILKFYASKFSFRFPPLH